MAGDSSAQATEIELAFATGTSNAYVQDSNGNYVAKPYTAASFTSPAIPLTFDTTGNAQWVKMRVPPGASLSIRATATNTAGCVSDYNINFWLSDDEFDDGSTLTSTYGAYEGSAANVSNIFGSVSGGLADHWVYVDLQQYDTSGTYGNSQRNGPPVAESFSVSFQFGLDPFSFHYGGYNSDYSQYYPQINGNGSLLFGTSTAGITSFEVITSTSSCFIKPPLAGDDIADAPDISQDGYTYHGVDAAGWNIGSQQPGEPGITEFGVTWVNTTWHRYNLRKAGSVRFYDDPALADAAAGLYGLSGTLIAVYSGPANATYADLTFIDANITINSAGTNYTAADLTVTPTGPTWLYIQHAFVGDLDNSASFTYPDQAMSWNGPQVTKPTGGGGGGTTPATPSDDGLFTIGVSMLGGDVGAASTPVPAQTDDGLFTIGISMLGGDYGVVGSGGTGGGGGGPTGTAARLAAKVQLATTITATLTKTTLQPRTFTCTGEVLSDASINLQQLTFVPPNAQPATLFV